MSVTNDAVYKLMSIGEIVDKILQRSDNGQPPSSEDLKNFVQELKNHGIYCGLKRVHDCLSRRKRSELKSKNGAPGPSMTSSNEVVINISLPLNHNDMTTTSNDYTRISSIINNEVEDNDEESVNSETESQRAEAVITTTAAFFDSTAVLPPIDYSPKLLTLQPDYMPKEQIIPFDLNFKN